MSAKYLRQTSDNQMKLHKQLAYTAALAGIFTTQSASSAVIAGAILNGSFEANAAGATTATSWATANVGTGATSLSIVTSPGVTVGANAASISVSFGDAFGTVFSQTRSTTDLLGAGMVNGTIYTISVDYTPTVTGGPLVQLGFDAYGPSFANYLQGYTDIQLTGVAGVTSTVSHSFTFNSALQSDSFVFNIRSGNYGSPVAFTLDNFRISDNSPIPEPSALALVGLASGALALRRSRK